MNILTIITKDFIAGDTLYPSVKAMVRTLKLTSHESFSRTKALRSTVSNGSEVFEITFYDERMFKADLTKKTFGTEGGALASIFYEDEFVHGTIIIPFLVRFCNEYPDAKIYRESNRKAHLFSVADIKSAGDLRMMLFDEKLRPVG